MTLYVLTFINFVLLLVVWISAVNLIKRMGTPKPAKLSKKLREVAEREAKEAEQGDPPQLRAEIYRRGQLNEDFAEESQKMALELAAQGKWPPRRD